MDKQFKYGLLAAAFLFGIASATSAMATPINTSGSNGEETLQQVFDNTSTQTPAGIYYSGPQINVQTDQYQPDSYWRQNASGGSHTQIVIRIAGDAQSTSFGIFNEANPSQMFPLYSGANTAGDKLTFGFDANASNVITGVYKSGAAVPGGYDSAAWSGAGIFGFYLTDSHTGNTFYSDPSMNGGNDQMVAYKGNGTTYLDLPSSLPGVFGLNDFLFAWEDTPLTSGSDGDYNDFVVYAESLTSVPEPSALGIFGLGLLLVGVITFRRNKSDHS
ncbi:MAG TPA: PEP-CTERM sorting domain-containing protein [Gammaproteobacteria bacterium]|nr:PEP-CTERM sorting domain-containing protein [Gammaproteobacteria bacterium]